jgi:hypothetical protein
MGNMRQMKSSAQTNPKGITERFATTLVLALACDI